MIFDKHLKLKLVRVSIEVNLILTCRSCSKFWSTSLGRDIYIHYAYLWYIYLYIYIWWCMSSSPISLCVVSFLSLHICFLFIVCNLLFMFHTKMFWWVCLKCFKNTGCQSLLCHELSSCKVFQEFVLG